MKKPSTAVHPGVPLGPLGPKSTIARHYVPPPQNFPQPARVCNASMPSPWVPPRPPALRPGADESSGETAVTDEELSAEEEALTKAGFDLADDLDRPDRNCDCQKCKTFFCGAAGDTEGAAGTDGVEGKSNG